MIGRRLARPTSATVAASNDQEGIEVDVAALADLAEAVLGAEAITVGELSLTFVDEPEIAELNATYLGESGPTDVLAFPLELPQAGNGRSGPEPVLLGDVVVCPAVASRYATANGRSLDDELALLVVHGVLHVLGYDHAETEEAAAMRAAEHRHLTAFHDPAWTWSGS